MKVEKKPDDDAIARWMRLPPIGTKPTLCEFCQRSYIIHCTSKDQSDGCLNLRERMDRLKQEREKGKKKS